MNEVRVPHIKIGADYFRTTVRKESIYPLAWRWIKETLQNAYDAGATKVTVNFYDFDKSIEIIDNGCGMDEDTLLDTFLSFGGSKKSSSDAIGGFGDAKKIVCFCWDRWEIHTLDNYLNDELMGSRLEKKDMLNGTRIRVWMDDLYSYNSVVDYLELCQVPVKISCDRYFNSEDVVSKHIEPKSLRKSKMIKEVSNVGTLYCNKSRSDKFNKLIVRLNGLALFSEYVSDVNACMVLELNPVVCSNPKDADYPLNVTRESLTYKYGMILERLMRDLMSSPSKALKSEREKSIVIHRGKGAVHGVRKSQGNVSNEGIICNEKQVVDSTDSHGVVVSDNGNGVVSSNTTKVVEYSESKNALCDVFPWDIIIKGKTNKRYDAVKYRKILLAWHKALQYVCYYNTLNGNDIELGDYYIGFVFEENVCAQRCEMSDGSVFYLINPSDLSFSDYGWKGIILEILARAIHEISHHFVREHNGSFQEVQTSIRSWCNMYMDDIFNDLGLIVKSKEKDLMFNASLDEVLDFD